MDEALEILKNRINEWCDCFQENLTEEYDKDLNKNLLFAPILEIAEIQGHINNSNPELYEELEKFKTSFERNMFKKRAEYLGLEFSDVLIALSSPLYNSPGYVVMYLSYIANTIHKNKPNIDENGLFHVTPIMFMEILNSKKIPDNKLIEVWDKQKLTTEERKIFKGPDNLLDYYNKQIFQEIYKIF